MYSPQIKASASDMASFCASYKYYSIIIVGHVLKLQILWVLIAVEWKFNTKVSH